MSKSYAKYKTEGMCTGSNTEYYRDRNRRLRAKNKNNIKKILKNKPIEDFDDLFIPSKEPDNTRWNEPTDGTCKMYANDYKKFNINNTYITKNNKIKK